MAIADNYVPIRTQGNGVTTVYTGNWAVINTSFLVVELEEIATGIITPQTLTTNYTLTFNSSGFTVTFLIAPPATHNVIIRRQVPASQETPYRTSKGFQGEVVENSFDKVTALFQGTAERLDRTVTFPVATGFSGEYVDAPVNGKFLFWNGASGDIGTSNFSLDENSILQFTADAAAAAAAAATATSSASAAAASASAAANAELGAQAAANSVTLQVFPTITSNANITLSYLNGVLPVDASGGAIVLTLQQASVLQPNGNGYNVLVLKTDNSANTVTIQRSGSDTINGATSQVLSVQNEWITIVGSGGSASWRGIKSLLSSIVSALGNVSGTTTLDLVTGIRSYSATVTGATTFVFSNPRASGNEDIFTLRLTNGGSSTVTWPTSVKWAGGTAPTLTASGVDELVFKTINGGTNWSGVALLDVK